MKKAMWRSNFREIRQSLGRFIAIMAIVALGVAFFAGLKITEPTMLRMAQNYLEDRHFYDFRLLSTLGFTDEDIEKLYEGYDSAYVEGAVSVDVLVEDETKNERVIKAHSIPEDVNRLVLKAGSMPMEADECVIDAYIYDESMIGKKIVLSKKNDEDTLESFTYKEYTVTGLVQSPLYIQMERGTTSLGNGQIHAFIYLPQEGFALDYYTEVYMELSKDYLLYSDEYEEYAEAASEKVETLTQQVADERYDALYAEAEEKAWEEIRKEIETEVRKEILASEMAPYMTDEQIEDAVKDAVEAAIEEVELPEFEDLKEPEVYVLGRETNVGYVCFENDAGIISGIANVFPLFFFMVAALVCMTTMNRMVEEQRTQIGVMKALGYGEASIMSRFVLYSGLAAITGAVVGYAGGTYMFPRVLWYAYEMMYCISELPYLFDTNLALISLIVSIICSIGVTYVTCHHALAEPAAELMRPKAPKVGKRVILEYIPFIWRRLKFLQKVTVRNLFRYKKRFFMMVFGIGGCTALLVTGFGVKDSIAGVANQQFGEITVFDIAVSYQDELTGECLADLEESVGHKLEDFMYLMEKTCYIQLPGGEKKVILMVLPDNAKLDSFIDLHTANKEKIALPKPGEIVICDNYAKKYGLSIGDMITIRDDDQNTMEVKIAAIAQNFINNYAYVSEETYKVFMEQDAICKTVYLNAKSEEEIRELSTELMELEGVSVVTVNRDTMDRVSNMMKSLDLVVVVIIFCAAGLAFIVLYNLTNINITERIREIATIKVLGFYDRETADYVFRENILLTFIGAAVGMVMGHYLHDFVMNEIVVENIGFDIHVLPVSYAYSVILTVVFSLVVNLLMQGKINKVSMTESLKSVD
ncbi:MAG: FtsX-like permease family protein [Lachnospiraceae bacterium]|nr:FtsX-like permease family protein [Lachnospiraceae bacterium]